MWQKFNKIPRKLAKEEVTFGQWNTLSEAVWLRYPLTAQRLGEFGSPNCLQVSL